VLCSSVTLKEKTPADGEVFVSVGGAAEEEKVVVEQRQAIEEAPRSLGEIPQQSVTDRDDDWFVLLDVFPRKTTYVPPGISTKSPPLSPVFIKASKTYP